jgi:thiamine-monophosphate kinase
MTEFELIRQYFASQPIARNDVRVGIGDDAAVIDPPAGTETVVTTDVLVAGVHFFEDVDPADLGHKSLAVNLSDLAAMGAEPAWFLLDITLPGVDPSWIERFARGLFDLAQIHRVQLIGGDTARGPLSVTITAIGLVPRGAALRRSGARIGDSICVTGTLGDAALALAVRRGEVQVEAAARSALAQRLNRPTPRIEAGKALRDVASSAIDISDGLLADLGHVVTASGVGARLRRDSVPLSDAYRAHLAQVGWDRALAGGDDYELCLTIPRSRADDARAIAERMNFSLTPVGEITAGGGVEIYDAEGRLYRPTRRGYDHFA